MEKLILLFFLVHQCSGIIYHLNATDYAKLPALYKMDDFDSCLLEPGGTYCLTDSDLYSNGDSELMTTLREYSEYKRKHFNHTKVHRALCVQKTCKDFIGNKSLDNEEDLKSVIQACVNNSLWNDYKLNTRLSKILYCETGKKIPYDTGDYMMAAVLLSLVILNALGTAYDRIQGDSAGNPYLMAFSIPRNWKKLVAPSGKGPEPRLNRLKAFNGMRAMTMVCVIFSHTALVMSYTYMRNPLFIEHSYDDPSKQILYNGTLVTYTFFVMSGFLLAFNFELHAEKHKVSFWDWPKGMVMRWLRLTPIYAVIMCLIMTLIRHFGNGPFWQQMVVSEAIACDQYWWSHLLYINNYIYDDSQCLPQTWYLAADTQLFGLGLLLCVLVRRPRSQMIALAIMLVVSLALPAAHVYFQDLGAVVHQSPETIRTLYGVDDTFRIVFIRGHTNMSTYTLGIAGGLLVYHWMKNEKTVATKLKKYAWVVWLSVPVGISTILTGGLFYMDGVEPSTLLRVLYATINKPIFQLNIVVIIIGCIFKVENIYRSILEWGGFTWPGRVAYSAFLVHAIFQRALIGIERLPIYMSEYYILVFLAATVVMSFVTGAMLWVTVENPLAAVVKAIMSPPKRKEKEPDEDTTTKI